MKRALITGITGQDGSYLAELLLGKEYRVYGLVRRSSTVSFERINHIQNQVELIQGDLTDQNSLVEAIKLCKPDEVYNLAGTSFVPTCFDHPVLTAESTALGVTRLLEAIRQTKPDTKFYQSSSSEMFKNTTEVPQSENTPPSPRDHYGIAKAYGYWATLCYRQIHNLFACSGICYNHESPRRGIEFLPRKVSDGVARIKLGLAKELKLGDLEARRDWGFAGDYVKAMWLMLQQDKPDTFVVATGATHSVRELVEIAFSCVELDYQDYVSFDKKFFRPTDGTLLVGDPSKAKELLGWEPEVTFPELIEMMVKADLRRNSR
ncbi:MAG: NAD-dependent epimerase/dehydratase family protein [Candidatus Aenigmarchaeota archaeon]|nr:NAD-dependent epimerase/dehydratase family protein [Candidatus Aenigmarchaeota archaeon]